MKQTRKLNFHRLRKIQENFDFKFTKVSDLTYDLIKLVPFSNPVPEYDYDCYPEIRELEKNKNFEIINPLKEYAIVKSVAITEHAFRDLTRFIIDYLDIEIKNIPFSDSIELKLVDFEKAKRYSLGLIISEKLSFTNPYLINENISELLGFNFHETLSAISDLVYRLHKDKTNFSDDNDDAVSSYNGLLEVTDFIKNVSDTENIFELRNDVAHNIHIISIDNDKLERLLVGLISYQMYGTALGVFVALFNSNVKNFDAIKKLDFFCDKDKSDFSQEQVVEDFEEFFALDFEILKQFIYEKKEKFKRRN